MMIVHERPLDLGRAAGLAIVFVRGFWPAVNHGTAPAPAEPSGTTQPTHG